MYKRLSACFSLFLSIQLVSAAVLLLGLSACAPIEQRSPVVDPGQEEVAVAPEKNAKNKPIPQEPGTTRPNIELTEDILYQLLLAEIAGQRGKLEVAVDNYLDLARTTRDPVVIGRATRIAVYARDDMAAKEAATLWNEVEPGNADALQVLAVMAIRNGNIQEAVDHLEGVMDVGNDGQIDQKLWMIANMLGREKDQETVTLVMERLMREHQNDPDALFAYAHVVSRMGKMEKAEDLLLQVMKLSPDNENALITYISLLQRQQKHTEAIVWLKEKLDASSGTNPSTNPGNFNLHLIYARLLSDAKRFEEARIEFEALDKNHPENNDVLYALGLLHLQANRLDDSKRYFIRLSKTGGRADEAGYYLGRILEEQNELDQARVWYAGVQQGEHYFDSQIRQGMILAQQGKLDEARKQLQNVITKNAEEKSILIQAEGEMLAEAKHYEEALKVYNQALESRYDADILYSRAMLAEKMDRLDILEADLKNIIEQDPKNAQALNALGYTLADRTERYQEAYEYIKQAIEVSPEDYYILDSMGWILYRLGRLEESVDYLRKAMALRSDPEIAAHLGEVLWVMGEKENAKNIWNTAIQETPEDTRLLDVIKRFTH